MSADKRHYNAYYGIGRVYERLGNFEKALTHLHAASVIHPTHAVLLSAMGGVLQKQKQIVQALPYFIKAVELAPRAPDVRLRKARALMVMGQLELAQKELLIVKDLAPDRAQVHFLLGNLAKMMRDKKTAVKHYTIALSLDPKASHGSYTGLLRHLSKIANRIANTVKQSGQGSYRELGGRGWSGRFHDALVVSTRYASR